MHGWTYTNPPIKLMYVFIIFSDYFGVSYVDEEDLPNWLDYEKKINKQISKGQWNFSFRVKFYPPEPSALTEDVTRFCIYK